MMRVPILSAVALALTLTGPVRAAEPDKFLPDDTTLVVHVNIRQSLDSPLGKKHVTPLVQQQLKKNAELTQSLTALGFDPLRDFESLTVATSGIDSTEADKELAKLTVVAHGTFDLAKVHAAADALIKQDPSKHSVSGQGDSRIYESKGETQTVYFAFVDKTTLVAAVADGALVLKRRPDTVIRLTPTASADVFSGSIGTITFRRDAGGRIVALSVKQDRVWDLPFVRQ